MKTMEFIKAAIREFFVIDDHILFVRFAVISLFLSVVIILLNP